MAHHIHRQIVIAWLAFIWIVEGMNTIACVKGAVTGIQIVLDAVEREPQRAPFNGNVLTRAGRVGKKRACVHARPKGGAHELKLHFGKHRGEYPSFPARGIASHVLFISAKDHDAGWPLLAKQTGNTGSQTSRNTIQHEHGGDLGPAFYIAQHAAADSRPGSKFLKGNAPVQALLADAVAQVIHAEAGREAMRSRGHISSIKAIISVLEDGARGWYIFARRPTNCYRMPANKCVNTDGIESTLRNRA